MKITIKNKLFVLAVMFVLFSSYTFATSPSSSVVIRSQPTNIYYSQNFSVAWSLNDPQNDTQNVTVKLFVNGVNVHNNTYTNILTNLTYTNTTTFYNSYYVLGDTVYVNFLVQQSSNASINNQSNSTIWTVKTSPSILLERDTLEGLPSSGTNIGGFIGNISGGLFKFILNIGMAVSILGIIAFCLYVLIKHKNKI